MSRNKVSCSPSKVRLTEASLRICSLCEKKAASFRTAGSSEVALGEVGSRGDVLDCQLPVTSIEYFKLRLHDKE